MKLYTPPQRITLLEDVLLKSKAIGKQQELYPVLAIYNTSEPAYKLSEAMDYLWFDELPQRFKNYTKDDLYSILLN